ncbi:ribosomal L7Ae/L30e/S12e/Gadd45 family protein [Irregularibacter muris]|uniref:ribosomal L7Ae/L30e/S12e/Gadd45 family protein n=1 Tax=Irregularibacter muris TaxID=1796619 RepID=UPI0027D454CF|nr:ribosomal L7Ae/L30e/S12e/Gadd45 family protein [Irregularibacter muris]
MVKNSKNKVVGLKQTRRAINEGKTKMVYLAKDVEPHLFEEIQSLCRENQVEVVYIENMKQLGEACGIDIKAASAAMLNRD